MEGVGSTIVEYLFLTADQSVHKLLNLHSTLQQHLFISPKIRGESVKNLQWMNVLIKGITWQSRKESSDKDQG